jgi:hypothetical protein
MKKSNKTKSVKTLSLLAALFVLSGCATGGTTTSTASTAGSASTPASASVSDAPKTIDLSSLKVDKKTQPRVLITTDLEVDDMNGILLTLMYANDYDLAGTCLDSRCIPFQRQRNGNFW